MARRVDCLDSDVADPEIVAGLQELMVVIAGLDPFVLPIGRSLVRQIEFRPEALRELACPREEVRVNVRLGGRRDRQTLGLGELDISVDVSLRVDDQRLARPLAAHQVGVLCELVVRYLSKKHQPCLPCMTARRAVLAPSTRP